MLPRASGPGSAATETSLDRMLEPLRARGRGGETIRLEVLPGWTGRALDSREAASDGEGGSGEEMLRGLVEALGQVGRQVEQLRQSGQQQTASVDSNTQAILQNASGGGSSTTRAIGKAASGILRGGLGLAPLVSGLTRLFGGGSEEAPASLNYFAPQRPVRIEGGTLESDPYAIQAVSYGQDGLPRGTTPGTALPPITIQVQAIDSQSFLDHKESIARAVREAILSSHSLRDVMAEL